MSNPGYLYQSSFATGELDPSLHDRTTLERHKNALRTATNVYIGRSGEIVSRQGTEYVETLGSGARVYIPKYSDRIVIFENNTITVRKLSDWSLIWTDAFVYDSLNPNDFWFVSSDISGFKFTEYDDYLIVYKNTPFGSPDIVHPLRINLLGIDTAVEGRETNYINLKIYDDELLLTRTAWGTVADRNTSGAYDVNYRVVLEVDGRNSTILDPLGAPPSGGYCKIPSGSSQKVQWTAKVKIDKIHATKRKKLIVYRAPVGSDNYGYVGEIAVASSDTIVGSYNELEYNFTDIGVASDYSRLTPSIQLDFSRDMFDGMYLYGPRNGAYFEGRHVVAGTRFPNQVFASRPKFIQDYTRDYPLSADSALALKTSSRNNSKINWFHEINGLAAFTTDGMYSLAAGTLTQPTSAYFVKSGNVFVQEQIGPLDVNEVPLAMNETDNSLCAITYSNEQNKYTMTNLSGLSSHLFHNKKVVSWDYQTGRIPLIWAVMNDGTAIAFRFNQQEEMRAFTRINTQGKIKQVVTDVKFGGQQDVYFVVERHGNLLLEKLSERYVSNLRNYNGSDSAVIKEHTLKDSFVLTTATIWDAGETLTITATVPTFANTAGNGAVGTVFRYYAPDSTYKDFTVTAFTSTTIVKVICDEDYPSEFDTFKVLHKTFNTVTGLAHLNGKKVNVVLDGFIEGSPLNKQYETVYTVSAGSITLPRLAGKAIVGLPYSCDVETLDVTTVEQKPVLPESKLLTSVYVHLYNARGVFISDRLPKDGTNDEMMDTEDYNEDLVEPNLNGELVQPYDKRLLISTASTWDTNGRIALRSVDPYPWELLSFISDLEIENR